MAKAELLHPDDDVIVVETEWTEKELIKQVPGTLWSANDRHWTVPKSWASCIIMRGVFGEQLEIGPNLHNWAWPVATEMGARREMRNLLEPEVRKYPALYPFQEVGAEFLRRTRETLLADEMGTGKTVTVCAALQQLLYDLKDALPAVIISPNSVKRSWARHVRDWTRATPYLIEGGAVQREKILKAAAADPAAVVIVNYEALRTLSRLAPFGSIRLTRCRDCDKSRGEEHITASRCQVHPRTLNKIPFKTVVIDEAHKIKSPAAQQTRAMWAVAHQPTVTYRWALTGTPIANHPGDMWSILHAISPREFPTKTHYVDRYCLQSWNAMGGLDIVGLNPALRDEFFSLLDPRFRRVRKDVVLTQLPPKIRSQRWVELTQRQRKMYTAFNKSLAVETEGGGVIVAATNLVAKLRQMQLSSANVETGEFLAPDLLLDSADVRMIEPSPKLDALEDILAELGDKPVAVCAFHRQLIDLAAARLAKKTDARPPISFGLITGAQSEYERDKALRDFQEGRIRVLLFTISAGGTGLTMTAADTLVFLQRSWSMVENKQAEDRIHRIGAEVHESIHIIDVVAADSVEEDQIRSLVEKFNRLNEITRDRLAATSPDAISQLDEEEDRILRSQL